MKEPSLPSETPSCPGGAAAAPSLPLPPPPIPDHELLRCIGRGAYGEVWLARSVTGAFRAVKIVRRSSFDHERPFEREFEGILKFEPISRTHDSQVDILHVGRGEEYFYYVMELADDQATGGQINPDNYQPRTLKSDLHFRNRLAFEQCITVGIALSTALEHLHQNGLVHRDVKPSNIIFVNGVAKLADIGLVTGLDTTRSYVGTEGFAAPEGPGSPQADLFSLGKVLYEMSTGKDRQEFPALPTNLREHPEREGLVELNAVITGACRHDPRDRYPNSGAMRADLELLQSGKSLARLRRTEHRLRLVSRAGAVVTALVVLVLTAWFYQRTQTREARELAERNRKLAAEKSALADENRENLYAADINLAQQALASDNLKLALELLQKHVPKPGERDLRGFEWRYLWKQCRSDELFSLQGHENTVPSVAFSPDGRRLVTGGYDGTVRIWDLAARSNLMILDPAARLLRQTEKTNQRQPEQQRTELRLRAEYQTASPLGHEGRVQAVSFSAQGDLLVAACNSHAYVWNTKSFQSIRELPNGILARFSPNGKFLVLATTNHLNLWDTGTWNALKLIDVGEVPIFVAQRKGMVAFSPDGRRLAVVLKDGLKLLSVPALEEMAVLHEDMPPVRFVSFSPNGQTVATSEHGQNVKLWDVETLQEIRVISGHSDSVCAAVFSPDGTKLATCSQDQTVKLWEVHSGKLIRTFRGHANQVWDVAFSPDGTLLASVGKEGIVKVWNATELASGNSELLDGFPLGFTADGKLMALIDGSVYAVEAETLKRISEVGLASFHFFLKDSIASDGNTALWPRGEDGLILDVFDLNRRRLICAIENPTGLYMRELIAPKRQLLATSTNNYTLLWQLPEGSKRFVLTNAFYLRSGSFSPDETMLATSEESSGVRVWKIDSDRVRRLSKFGGAKLRAQVWAFSPDSKMLAVGEYDGDISLWEPRLGHRLATLTAHRGIIRAVSFSPDGRTLASVGDDRHFRLWHVKTQRELLRFDLPPEHDARWHSCFFSPNGQALVYSLPRPGKKHLSRVLFAPSLDEIALEEGTELAKPKDPISWHVRGTVLVKRDRLENAVQAFGEAIEQCAEQSHLHALRASALAHRSQVFKSLGRLAEAGADNCAALEIPVRDPHVPARLVDLSAYFTDSLDRDSVDRLIPFVAKFPGLPRGRQKLPGAPEVEFDLRGIIQLNYEADRPGIPHEVQGISVRQKCRRLQFLHGTYRWNGQDELDGAVVAIYVIHYAEGQREEIPIYSGNDLQRSRGATVAWEQEGSKQLFTKSWKNPHPEIEIQTMDFISKMTQCAPFLVAITAEP